MKLIKKLFICLMIFSVSLTLASCGIFDGFNGNGGNHGFNDDRYGFDYDFDEEEKVAIVRSFYGIGEGTEAVIPDEVKKGNIKYNVTGIDNWAFEACCASVIKIGNNVKRIGEGAFQRCEFLKSITIPDSVTCIKRDTFSGCYSLESIEIPDSVTSIGDFAFEGCSSLTSIEIPDSVVSIGSRAFSRCSSLTSITIGAGVTSIGKHAFDIFQERDESSLCSSLKSIKVDPNNTAYDSRNDCNGIIETKTNTLILGCDNTIIPDTVTSIGPKAFVGCHSLISIEIPSSVTSIGGEQDYRNEWRAFIGCYRLVEICVRSELWIEPGSNEPWEGLWIEPGDNEHCGAIGEYALNVYYPDFVDPPVDDPEIADYLEEELGRSVASKLSKDNDFIVYTDDEDKIIIAYLGESTDLVIPNYITKINNYAFCDCSSLTSVTIPTGVTSIGKEAFKGCSSLESIEIPDSIISIDDGAFRGCSSLTSITIPASVTSIGIWAFEDCYKLVEVCNSSSLNIDEQDPDYPYPFFPYALNVYNPETGSSKLTTDEDGYVVYNDDDGKMLIAYHGKETDLVIPSYIKKINQYAFSGCSSLTSVTIPKSVRHIGDSAFKGCSSLTINCEADEDSVWWNNSWNPDERPVNWNFTK